MARLFTSLALISLMFLHSPANACTYPPGYGIVAQEKDRLKKSIQPGEVIIEVVAVGMRTYQHKTINSWGMASVHMIVVDGEGMVVDGSRIEFGLRRPSRGGIGGECAFRLIDSTEQVHSDPTNSEIKYARGYIVFNPSQKSPLFGSGFLPVNFMAQTADPKSEIIWQDYVFRGIGIWGVDLKKSKEAIGSSVEFEWIRGWRPKKVD